METELDDNGDDSPEDDELEEEELAEMEDKIAQQKEYESKWGYLTEND